MTAGPHPALRLHRNPHAERAAGARQAVQVEQSILWKMFGWYRIKMTIAGVGIDRPDQGGLTRNVALPVGNARETAAVLRLLLPGLDEQQAQVLMAAARSSQKRQVPGAPQMLQVPSTARWLDPLTLHVKGLTSINVPLRRGIRAPPPRALTRTSRSTPAAICC